ncbi:hypothetical protein PPL_07415 [Heterostelium album PN500]|uniref:mRNA guanylyltransferase n=1 Tax=Heterostelium pallidum (strain ATCC 26659 / Pp 5 / PN500) TaxID=670386 RepID=D3BFW4_HETP5|nr:hypothetical protein PPL_07415 [Heterostelium album PN500]EFA79724.1 hypothetical protein PPL_07415 [Heterostelium album PN500]|eukprot:XP_020431845.1 hypothetical protein PPL_07415 [Heterostelium album PN500]
MSYKRINGVDESDNRKKRRNDDFDAFDSIIGDMHKSKEATTQGKTARSTFSSEAVIKKIIDLTKENDVMNLEVEARIGRLTSEFKSGVIQEDFNTLYSAMRSKFGEPTKVTETDHIFDDYRIVFCEDTQKVLRKESKVDKNTFNLPTNLIYDIRISVSIEQQLPVPIYLPEGNRPRRYKTRYTFTDKQWKIDLTQVINYTPGVETQVSSLEVEVELLPNAIEGCTNVDNLKSLLNRFLNEAKSLISMIQPKQTLSFPDVEMEKVSNFQEIMDLKKTLFQFMPGSNENKQDTFPGSMPINFGKKYFSHVQANDYYVSEKTDGVRYLLLIAKDNVYLVDRKFDFYSVKFDKLIEIYGNDTLMDGEMIRQLRTKKPIFLVFDLLSCRGVCVAGKDLSGRIEAIRNSITGPFMHKVENQHHQTPLPFLIWGKNFFNKTQIESVFKSIKQRGEDRQYVDHKREHNTDGIIFTPNTPYTPYTQNDLFKWKYLDKWTIDFKIMDKGQKGWYLTCIGNGNSDVEIRSLNFSRDDIENLQRDFKRARDPNTVIVECSFQPNTGKWKYHMVRADKFKANYISIVMDTMESIAEAISSEELQYRIPLKHEADTWDYEIQKMRAAMLQNLKNKKKAGNSSSSSSSSSSSLSSNNTSHSRPPNSNNSSANHQHSGQRPNNNNSNSSSSNNNNNQTNSAYYQGSNFEGDPFGTDEDIEPFQHDGQPIFEDTTYDREDDLDGEGDDE